MVRRVTIPELHMGIRITGSGEPWVRVGEGSEESLLRQLLAAIPVLIGVARLLRDRASDEEAFEQVKGMFWELMSCGPAAFPSAIWGATVDKISRRIVEVVFLRPEGSQVGRNAR